jgi:ketosteroid isomerase-like protein
VRRATQTNSSRYKDTPSLSAREAAAARGDEMFLYLKVFLAVSIAFVGVNQRPPKDPRASVDVNELGRLEQVWNEAQLNGDADALNRLWDDDLVVTVPNMPVMDKNESLDFVRSGKMKFQTYKTSDIRIRLYGDVAVVTGQLERRRSVNRGEFEEDWRFTKVYVRRAGKWKVVAWHGSPVGH